MTESYQGIFTLSVLCFNKNAKFSVMNAPYKRPNNSDLLFIDLLDLGLTSCLDLFVNNNW